MYVDLRQLHGHRKFSDEPSHQHIDVRDAEQPALGQGMTSTSVEYFRVLLLIIYSYQMRPICSADTNT